MGCICSKFTRKGVNELSDYAHSTIIDYRENIVIAIAETQLSNDEEVTTPIEPLAPIAATSNPLVTSSLTQTEQNQPPEQRETVTSRSSVPTVGDNEEESSSLITTSYGTPTLTTIARSVPFTRFESVNDDATLFKVEETMDKTRGPKTLPNEIKNKKPPIHESPTPEYTEATEATLCTQTNTEEELPSTSDTPPMGYQVLSVPETLRSEDVEFRDEDYGFVDISVINNRKD